MRYRVDELAGRCAVSVDTVRFYQAQGLLPAPKREGRLAWYSDDHLDRLKRIRELKDKGFSLASIKRLLSGTADEADEALVSAVAGSVPGDPAGELLTVEALAERTGVSPALLGAIEREGLISARMVDGEARYTAADADAVRSGLSLLEAGLPLSELLDLARKHDEAMRTVAEQAVEMFITFVRDPIRASVGDEAEAGDRLVEAFRKMLPATSALVANHFQRVLLKVAQERIKREGLEIEIEGKAGPQWPS